MANLELLRLLVRLLHDGPEAWNKWRMDNREVEVDFSGHKFQGMLRTNLYNLDLSHVNFANADLSNANLSGSNLSYARLWDANLSRASLDYSDLHGAELIRANLRNVTFIEAHLDHADLSLSQLTHAILRKASLVEANLNEVLADRTSFRQANLSGAQFIHTILSYTDLRGARLDHARFGNTIFGETDLTNVEGLGTCYHVAPSTLDYGTSAVSGALPPVFLRGCGLPDEVIELIPALISQPIQFYSCFISYSSKDQEFANKLHADLQGKRVRCWFAPEDLQIGDRFRTRIDEVIRVYDKLLLVLSENSVSSTWVEKEVETAMEREAELGRTMLFPVRLDNSVMEIKAGWPADIRRTRHIGDFLNWKDPTSYQKAFEGLLRDLEAEASL